MAVRVPAVLRGIFGVMNTSLRVAVILGTVDSRAAVLIMFSWEDVLLTLVLNIILLA